MCNFINDALSNFTAVESIQGLVMKFMLPSRYLIYHEISKLYIVSDSEVANEKKIITTYLIFPNTNCHTYTHN